MEPVVARPAIVRFVENWQRGWVPDTPGRLSIRDVQQLGLASSQARARYPGPVGELIVREIWAYTDFGHRFDSTGVVPRIVAELLVAGLVDPRTRNDVHAREGDTIADRRAENSNDVPLDLQKGR